MLRHLLTKYNNIVLASLAALFSLLATQFMMHGGYYLYGVEVRRSEQVISTIAPLSIAFFVTWFLFGLLKKLDFLEQKMRELAKKDQLSETLTKTTFLEHAEDRIKVARRENQKISLLMMDIDNFKKVNDTYGHIAGDLVIKSVGQLLNRSKREADLVGRFGGDEFLMLLWGTDAAGAIQFSNHLRQEVKNLNLIYNENNIKVSISIGLSGAYEDNQREVSEIVSQADKALYAAKELGRDRSVTFEL